MNRMDSINRTVSAPQSVITDHSAAQTVCSPTHKSSSGLLHKLFSRSSGTSRTKSSHTEDDSLRTSWESQTGSCSSTVELAPCPFIRPLQSRLEPRIESSQGFRRGPQGRITKVNAGPPDVDEDLFRDDESESGGEVPDSNDAIATRAQLLWKEIASAATADMRHVKQWAFYIKCYSEGCYNVISPPEPPPMNPDFTHLPATFPSNEAQRLATFKSSRVWSGSDIIWTEAEAERARQLIKAADIQFDAPWGAISFFDTDLEIVQAERGYSRHFIPRRISIASHVLLTNEVMTVLDTEKDWRFRGNPLVTGDPKIRFFAGAPLLSPDGEVIGVFAIFSPVPRASFTARQRRELTTFSEVAMRELTSSLEADPGQNGPGAGSPTVAPVQQLSPAYVTGAVHGEDATSPQSRPAALRYHKGSQQTAKARVILRAQNKRSVTDVPMTPPNSLEAQAPMPTMVDFGDDECSDQRMPHERQSFESISTAPHSAPYTPELLAFGEPCLEPPENESGLSPNADMDAYIQHESYHMLPPEVDQEKSRIMPMLSSSAGSQKTSSSKASSKTLRASVSKQGRPRRNIIVAPTTQFLNQNGMQVFDRSPPYATPPEWPLPATGNSATQANKQPPTRSRPSPTREPSCTKGNPRPIPKRSSLRRGWKQVVSDPVAEAQFAAEFWAKHLRFDTIYALELIPKHDIAGLNEILPQKEVTARIVVSYGLHQAVEFDIPMHLEVLRAGVPLTWQIQDESLGEYGIGFMMPMRVRANLLSPGSEGMIFGAFRRETGTAEAPSGVTPAEIRCLQHAARVLKNILCRTPIKGGIGVHKGLPPIPLPINNLDYASMDAETSSLDGPVEHVVTNRRPIRSLSVLC